MYSFLGMASPDLCTLHFTWLLGPGRCHELSKVIGLLISCVSNFFVPLTSFYLQATSLRGVDVTATVEEVVKGTIPPFDQGTVGINVMPLGSVEVGWKAVSMLPRGQHAI